MWLINVVIILPWLFIITLMMMNCKKNNLNISILIVSVICEAVFVMLSLLDKNVNNILQVMLLVFGYLVPIAATFVKLSSMNFKIKLLYILALVAGLFRDYETAERVMERIVKITKNNKEYLYKLVDIYKKEKKLSKQRDILFDIVQLDRNDSNAYYELGLVLEELGKRETAIVMLSNALNIDKNLKQAKEELGIIYSDIGKYKEAMSMYEEIIAEDSGEDYMARYNLAIIYSKQGDVEKAIKAYKNALEINSKIPNAWYELGKLYYMQGDNTLATESLEKALKQDKQDYRVCYSLSKCYAVERDYDSCKKMLERAIKLNADLIEKAKEEIVFKEIINEIINEGKEKIEETENILEET